MEGFQEILNYQLSTLSKLAGQKLSLKKFTPTPSKFIKNNNKYVEKYKYGRKLEGKLLGQHESVGG